MNEEPRVDGTSRLPQDLEPPAELEDAVVDVLHERGLLGRRSGIGRGWAAAAILTAFLAGGLAARLLDPQGEARPSPAPGAVDGRPLYALLLYQDARFDQLAGAHRPERVHEYRRWLGSLRERGRFADGERLASSGLLLSASDGGAVAAAASPLGGLRGRLTGFFLIEAADDAEARSIAEACPHLAHGGTVELRRIERGG